jgi:precorrin-2 dehydrogenase/sirohydrochlorin ferrochelatase
MGIFPIFIDIKDRPILVVGAGNVAARKIEKLLPFGPRIIVVAPRVSDEVEGWLARGLIQLQRRPFEPSDIDGSALAIVAADNISLQKKIYEICLERKIPCNSVDSPAYCSFIFPALVTRGDMTVGISTGGKAPGLTAKMRRFLDEILPDDIAQKVERVAEFRKSSVVSSKPLFADRAQEVIRYVEELFEESKAP